VSYSPTLADVIDTALTRRLQGVHTALPARVEAYDAATQTVDAQPLVQAFALEEDGTFTWYALPVVTHVPVTFTGGGGFRGTYPVAQGDTVLLVFAEASLDAWQPAGGVSQPPDLRRHHLADAIAIAGLHDDGKPWTGASTSAATWGKDGGPQVVARAAGIELGGDDANPPTEALVLGTTYTADENTMLDTLLAQLATAATALTAAAASLATATTALAVPTVGGAMAATPLGVVVAQVTTAATSLQSASTAITNFRATDAAHRSQKVKTA
jgi:hypothetical protein